jgi:hypothetical protein
MTRALADVPPSTFERPSGIVDLEICADSGTRPSPYCPTKRLERFAENRPPLDASHDLWQMVLIDAASGLRANEFCADNAVEKIYFAVPPEDTEARDWAIAQGYDQPPDEFCTAETRPLVNITAPLHNEIVPQGMIPVQGQVQLSNFDHYEVTFGVGADPLGWGWVSGPHLAQVADGELTVWDTTHLTPGLYTLRVVAFTREGATGEARVIVDVAGPEPTSTATQESPTATPITATPLPTITPVTVTPLPTVTPTRLPPTPGPSPTPKR